jgi:uncharacterized protein
MSRTVRVLSIDGGGVRGLVPATVLSSLERTAQRPVHELFDLVAGTSTGAILAASLCAPMPKSAAELVDLYLANLRRIFREDPVRKVTSVISSGKYDHAILESILEDNFGLAYLSDCRTNLLIPAYDIENRDAKFFKSWRARGIMNPSGEKRTDADYFLSSIVRAATAAPTYFEPARISSRSGIPLAAIDGAVFANNPAMCALASARRLYPDAERFMILSLGTGQLAQPIPYEVARRYGIVSWARPVLDCMMDGAADIVDYQLEEAFPTGLEYIRLQTDMRAPLSPSDSIDDVTPENIRRLIITGQKLASESSSEISRIMPILNGLVS